MDGRKGDLSVGEWGSAGMDRTSIGKGESAMTFRI